MIDRLLEIEHHVENGNMKAHVAYAEIYELEQAIKSVKESIKDAAIDEVSTYGKGDEPVVKNYRMTIVGKTTYNYKSCPTWGRMKANLSAREALMKRSMAMHKAHGSPLVDENGEEIPIPEIKGSSYIKMEAL